MTMHNEARQRAAVSIMELFDQVAALGSGADARIVGVIAALHPTILQEAIAILKASKQREETR